MSGFHVGDEVIHIFGQGGGERIAKDLDLPLLATIPLDPAVCAAGDEGEPMVARQPDAPVSRAFSGLARAVADGLARTDNGAEADLTLEW